AICEDDPVEEVAPPGDPREGRADAAGADHEDVHAATRTGRRLTQCVEIWYECPALRVSRPRHYNKAQGPERQPVDQARPLDELHSALVEARQQNGRASFRRIAAEVGVSEATIRARYQRLCDDGVVQVIAVTNPLGLGFGAMAMVGVRTAKPPVEI